MRPRLKIGRCLEQLVIRVTDWNSNPEEEISRIQNKFNGQDLAIRSSADFEDGHEHSNAGALESQINVSSREPSITAAVDAVIASYGNEAGHQEVLVQPMVREVALSGVILTRELDTGAPYYVINYDDFSGRTDTVTGGGESKMVMVLRSNPEALHSPRMRRLVDIAREIEDVTGSHELDIEFCATDPENDGNIEVFVLQVRPLAASRTWHAVPDEDVDRAIFDIQGQLGTLLNSENGLAGETTILGEMPDWNPAEIIGNSPRPLALSLYKYLITDRTWSVARQNMGYRDVDRPLLIDFIGRPYIDVRRSLNSFLPEGLGDDLAGRLIDHQLARLADNKIFHDKIEFEIALTCIDLSFDEEIPRLRNGNFSKQELGFLHDKVLQLTNRAIELGKGGLLDLLNTTVILNTRRLESSRGSLENVKPILDETINHGTLPFSILARHAFIGVSMLRSLVARDLISKQEMERFMLDIRTVATDFLDDMGSVADGRLSLDDFLTRYGHLRPGTYDILSWRYDEKPDFYLGALDHQGPREIELKGHAFQLPSSRMESITRTLNRAGFTCDAAHMFDYISTAIAAREQAKFMFTKGISDVLKIIGEWGDTVGITRDALSFLKIDTLLAIDQNRPDLEGLKSEISQNKQTHRLARAIRLPQIIAEPDDIAVVYPARGQATFVTAKSVTAQKRLLHTNEIIDLDGCIVLIESADPGFDWIFSYDIVGLVTQYGGSNSHMAIRCAEFGLPAAIGCGERTFVEMSKCSVIELNCGARKMTGH